MQDERDRLPYRDLVVPRHRAALVSEPSIVLARYWQSGWVYGQLDGLDPEWLWRVQFDMAQPQVNVLLDAPAEICLERRAARDGKVSPERYEGKLEFTRQVVGLYRRLWDDAPAAGRWAKVDATLGVEAIVAETVRICRELPR